ncbi:MAG: hypothetical protein E6G35_02610 [Actinobacteria bacterium]|nr:MAG: hypothetical protein E6G35_02610 [Actinomycetota bacterium]
MTVRQSPTVNAALADGAVLADATALGTGGGGAAAVGGAGRWAVRTRPTTAATTSRTTVPPKISGTVRRRRAGGTYAGHTGAGGSGHPSVDRYGPEVGGGADGTAGGGSGSCAEGQIGIGPGRSSRPDPEVDTGSSRPGADLPWA